MVRKGDKNMITAVGVFGTLIDGPFIHNTKRIIAQLFKQLYEKHGVYVWIVSDCLDAGVPKVAFQEALKYGWYTIGIHSMVVTKRYPMFMADHFILVEDDNDLVNILTDLLSLLIYDVDDERAKKIAQALIERGIPTIGWNNSIKEW